MKTYILVFKNQQEAYNTLIENGFGYISPSFGPIVMTTTINEYNLKEIKTPDSYLVQIDFVTDMKDDVKTNLKVYIKEEV